MAEQDSAATQDQQQPQVAVQKIYIKDASIEVPHGPHIFAQEFKPDVNVDLNSAAQKLNDQNYHVQLTVTLTAKQDNKTVYLVEVQQAGVFLVAGFDEQQREQVLGAYCPSILFGFIREAVANMVQRAGFPAFMLQPVNFDALYQQQKQANQQAAAEAQ